MEEKLYQETDEKMTKALKALEGEFNTLRTGRASLAVLDGIMVDAYGTPTPIKQVATMSTPDARLIAVQPWDKSLIGNIEKAILAANIGLTPINDGKLIRINIPQLTEERRKELVKVAKHMAEEAKVAVRNVRRHINDSIKEAEKKLIEKHGVKSWDEMFPSEEYYQIMHLKLFPKGLVHAENVGGEIEKVSNKRVWIGCFPLRGIELASSMCRIIALEPPE